MLAPPKPKGLEESIGMTMHKFLLSQLDRIVEEEDKADNRFSKGMRLLYKKNTNPIYTNYYEQLYEIANNAQQQRRALRSTPGVCAHEDDEYGR